MNEKDLAQLNQSREGSESDPFTEARYRQMAAWLPKNCQTILDAGCNTGRGGIVLKSLRPETQLIGMDCVAERLSALDPACYAESRVGFLHQTGLDDQSLDAIVAGEILEHIPGSLVDASLAECYRILRLRGRLILTTPNPCSLRFRLKGWSVLLEESHLSQHHPSILKIRLRMHGFGKILFRGSGRSSLYIGDRLPLACYGSYLAVAEKW